MVPDPTGISFIDWMAALSEEYSEVDIPIVKVEDESQWKNVVEELMYREPFYSLPLHEADGFASWRDWARWLIGQLGG